MTLSYTDEADGGLRIPIGLNVWSSGAGSVRARGMVAARSFLSVSGGSCDCWSCDCWSCDRWYGAEEVLRAGLQWVDPGSCGCGWRWW